MKNIILSIILFGLTQCNSQNKSSEIITQDECERLSIQIQELVNNYLLFDEKENYGHLDSALQINEFIEGKCGKYNANISLRKLAILSLKRENLKALEYAELLNDSLVAPEYKSIIVNRFRAVVAQERGDTIAKNQYIRKIIETLKEQLPRSEVDFVLHSCNEDSVMQYAKFVYLLQYYYYRTQLEGRNKIINELEVYEKKCNTDFLWPIKPKENDDFLIFMGI